MRILDRYILREVAQTWFAVTVVLLFILLTNQFAKVLGDVAKDRLPRDAVLQVIGLTGLQYMTILVPIGLFLAIMLALGRLYADSELPAMMACRSGPMSIYRPLLWLLLPLVAGVGWLAVDIGPLALTAIERIGVEARRQADLASIEPGKFISNSDAGAVVYAEQVLGPGRVANVFVQRSGEEGRIEVVVAKRGEQRDSDDPDTRFFVMYDGRRYMGVPGTTRFNVVEFAEHGLPYRLPTAAEPRLEARAKPTRDLFSSRDPEDVAELHWRIGVPLATLVLGILAVPLSRTKPRQGRYGRIAVGLLVFIIYFNLLSAGKAWLEKETLPAIVGIWWVHGLMLAVALGLLGLQNGVHRRLFR
ncbi:MAG: LPS export ABC transporter permease LptF [Gammaproteobacteria bacterium]|nr:LPS export ABC transporter permease LptF [Gammaproteobacteria bacterium]MDH4253984.1 LPS export ABC transporter permease LptF [Gammaproteobacteria bacterium]MDH5308875.1 LPS export ABC transporter permease LptF [Gammaproteobacteria bacterium]